MRTLVLIFLAFWAGFLGAAIAFHLGVAPMIFVNGEELKPVGNKIQIQIGRGDGLTSSVDQFGTLEVYILPK